MHFPSLISLALIAMPFARALGDGRLLVSAPDDAVSCQPAQVQWVWTGSAEDAETNVLSVAVVPEDGYFRRHNFEKRSTQLIKRRPTKPSKRDVGINIAGGANVPMSAQTWTWSSVGVTPGRYRIGLTVSGAQYTSYSAIFTVSAGADLSCLGISGSSSTVESTNLPDASTTTSDPAAASTTAQPATTTASSVNTSSVSAVTPTSSTSTAASSPISANAQSGSNDGSDATHHGGKIAAAVLVPMVAIGLVFLYFCLRRKKSMKEASAQRKDWSEKALNLLSSRGQGPSHARNISQPTNPVHAGGLTHHADEIRAEMQEVRNMPGMSARVMSPTGTEHWVDFAGETDACPVTQNDMEEILRASMDQQRRSASELQASKKGGLYQQGENLALRESMLSVEGSTSTSSAASTLPAYLREVRSPAPSFGQDAEGRPIVVPAARAARLSQETVSQTSTVTHQLSRNGSIASTATIAAYPKTTNEARDLTRNNSRSGSIRRKPVPHDSFVARAVESHDQGPFADHHTVVTSASQSVSEPPATKSLPHFSVQSGPVIANEQLQEMLDSEGEATPAPRQSHFADAPMSVYDSPAPINHRDSAAAAARFTGRSLIGPIDVGSSDVGSPFPDSQSDAWKLSVRLSEQDRGFRVSFPVDDSQSS